MRKLRWPILGLIAILAIAFVFAGRPKSNGIEALKPFTYREQITYTTMALQPGVVPSGYQQHIYWLRGIDAKQLMRILKDETKKTSGIANSFPTSQYFSYHASNSTLVKPSHDLVAMSGAVWMPMATPANERKQVVYTVLDEVPLTKFQVLMFKLTHPHNNPFSM